jgi:hypothetical protein
LKSATTGQYLDICNKCLKDLDIPVVGNNKADTSVPLDDDDDDLFEEGYEELDDADLQPEQ